MDNLELEYVADPARYKTTGERPLLFYKYNQTILCPFQNKLPLVNKLTGQMQLEATPCNELCPHFSLVETLNEVGSGKEMFVDICITCSGSPKNIRLVVEQPKDNQGTSILQP